MTRKREIEKKKETTPHREAGYVNYIYVDWSIGVISSEPLQPPVALPKPTRRDPLSREEMLAKRETR